MERSPVEQCSHHNGGGGGEWKSSSVVFSLKQSVSSVESKEGKCVPGLRNEGMIVWESWRVDLPGKCDRMNRLHQ